MSQRKFPSLLIGIRRLFFLTLALVSSVVCSIDTDEFVCGTVTTSEGKAVKLKEKTTLSSEEFEHVHVKKLKGAMFHPSQNCVIKVCGFTSYDTPYDDKLLGSPSDYSDCRFVRSESPAPPDIYNNVYNTSSISCACKKETPGCSYTCEDRQKHREPDWKENGCAVLFQEDECVECHFDSIMLEKNVTFSTDNSHHPNSIYVRDGCVVRQNIPAFKHYYRFRTSKLPINYTFGMGSINVVSAFHTDPETFYCDCAQDSNITTTTEIPPTSSKTPISTTMVSIVPPKNTTVNDNVTSYVLYAVCAITTLSSIVLAFVVVKLRRESLQPTSSKLSFQWLPHIFSISRGSNDSNETLTTTTSNVSGPLDFKRLINSPFDEAYDTPRELFQIGEKINEGHYGQIFSAKVGAAAKVMRITNDEEAFKALHADIKFLCRIGPHKNVVRLLGVHYDNFENGELHMFVELCQNGSLKTYLKNEIEPRVKSLVQNRRKIPEKMKDSKCGYAGRQTINFMQEKKYDLKDLDPYLLKQMYYWSEQIAEGMAHISSAKVIHGDLSAKNILLNHKLVPKVADFGLSRKTYLNLNETPDDGPSDLPIRWLAPEVLRKHEEFSIQSDIWSYGVTIWEIFTLGEYLPYEKRRSPIDIANAQKRSEKPGGEIGCVTREVYLKLLECWDKEPKNRPSFKHLQDYFCAKKNELEEELAAGLQNVGSQL